MLTNAVLIFYHREKLVQKLKTLKNSALKTKQSEFTLTSLASTYDNDDNVIPKPKVLIFLIWTSYSLILPLTYVVTFLFFLNEISHGFYLNNERNSFNIWLILNTNVFNSVIITIEFVLSLIPLRVYHFYYSVFYATFYISLTVFMENQAHNCFFSVWHLNVMLVPFVFVTHIFFALIYRVKLWLFYEHFMKHKNENEKTIIVNQPPGTEDLTQNTGKNNIAFLAGQ